MVRRISISGFAFHPDSITVSGPTEVTVTNDDTTTHTFTLDDGSVDEKLDPGASTTVTIDVASSTGFHCNIHPQMTGTIEVGLGAGSDGERVAAGALVGRAGVQHLEAAT